MNPPAAPPLHVKPLVISLERTPERRRLFLERNPQLSCQFVAAVDGRNASPDLLNNPAYFEHPNLFHTSGAYGCALSHVLLWEHAIQTQQTLTIAEDDAVFRADFNELAPQLLAQLPSDWDLVMWGWNFDALLSMWPMGNISKTVVHCDQQHMRSKLEEFRTSTDKPHLHRLERMFGTPAYTISSSGAAKFKRLCLPIKKQWVPYPFFNRPLPVNGIDIAMNAHFPSTQSYVSFPPMVLTPNEHSVSTVQPTGA